MLVKGQNTEENSFSSQGCATQMASVVLEENKGVSVCTHINAL